MCLLGGRRHWFGPAIGAIIIFTLNDALSDTSMQFVNEIAVGGLLIAIILFMPEGIYDRLRARILPAIVLAMIVIVLQALFVGGRITEQASVVMLVVVGLLMIPTGFYNRFIGRYVPLHRLPVKATGPVPEPSAGGE
jgi:hypothetical protein